MSGPTHFGSIIERVTECVRVNLEKKVFSILMIITDGDIHDIIKIDDVLHPRRGG